MNKTIMSNPDGRPIEPKGSADAGRSGRMGTTGRRCALCATLKPSKTNLRIRHIIVGLSMSVSLSLF